MNLIDIHRKYRVQLSTLDLETLMGILVTYLNAHEGIHSADIADFGQCLRVVRIGQRLQAKLFKLKTQGKRKTSITLDASEADTIVSVFGSLNSEGLNDLDRSVIYNIYSEITTKL